MSDALYKKSFSLFLQRTDEKSVIEKFIREHIPLNRNMEFLDVGAGEGSLATVISKEVKTTLVIEPNQNFCQKLLKQERIEILNERWENVHLNRNFDFILAAYVVTYFPEDEREELIKKMYDCLRPGGTILILSVDAKKGSWRKIHTYFYELMGRNHASSDEALKQIVAQYKATAHSFITHVVAKNVNEMLEILAFDFYKYPEDFSRFSDHLKKLMRKFSNEKGEVVLEMVHNAYIIEKHETL